MRGEKRKQDFAGHAKFEILIRKPTGDKEIPGYRSVREVRGGPGWVQKWEPSENRWF